MSQLDFFFRGVKANYNEALHSKGFYIATDTHELIAGGVTVGINPGQMQEILDFMSSKGQSNGLATLDENGKIPVSQLNGDIARVQGIDAVATSTTLPTEGLINEYTVWCIDTKTLKIYSTEQSTWRDVAPTGDTIYSFRNSDATGDTSRTNILYRWDGASMVEISESLAIGETAGTAYEGSKGKANADAIAVLQEEMQEVQDNKVSWDETKKIIQLPIDGSITAVQDLTTGSSGVVLCQRSYDNYATTVTEVGNVRNKLTLNAAERPQIDLADGGQEKVAYESEIQLVPSEVNIPIRTLKDQVYDQQTILEWFGVETISELKDRISRRGIQYLKFGLSLQYNPHYYKMPIEYVAFESANQIKLVLVGLDTSNDVPSKYEILINLDGTIIEGNSNIKLTVTPLANTAEEIQAQIESIIVQELGTETMKVISQKVVSDYINQIVTALNSVIATVGTPKTETQEATGLHKVIDDNKAAADAAIENLQQKVGDTPVIDQIQQAINDLKDGVSTEYDTLKKIEDMIKKGDSDTLASANQYVDNALRWIDVQ